MTQRGMSLIELAIALFIGSLLSILLFNVLNQANTALVAVESLAAADINVVTFYDRFERDITGVFIPAIGDPDLADKAFAQQLKQAQEQEQVSPAPQAKGALAPSASALSASAPKNKAKSSSLKDIQVKRVFVYEEKENNLALFSFVTDNPAVGYHQEKPRIVRVVYTLKHEPKATTYALWRKESLKLGIKKDEQAREYCLLRNIQSLRLELLAPAAEEKAASQQAASQQAAPQQAAVQEEPDKKTSAAPLIVYKVWPAKNEDTNKDVDKAGQKIGKDLPQFVKVYLRYSDARDKQAKIYEFVFPISCYRAPSQTILNVQLIHQQREEQKKQQAEQQTQQDKQRAAPTSATPSPKNPSPGAGLAGLMGGQNSQQRRNTVGA